MCYRSYHSISKPHEQRRSEFSDRGYMFQPVSVQCTVFNKQLLLASRTAPDHSSIFSSNSSSVDDTISHRNLVSKSESESFCITVVCVDVCFSDAYDTVKWCNIMLNNAFAVLL